MMSITTQTASVMRAMHSAPVSLFWYFINERHAIYMRRAAGQPKPWTDDPILRDYKFTNVYRQLDTGTVWLTERFITPHWDDEPGLLAANIGWYRLFNWTGTGERIGWQTAWRSSAIRRKLHKAHDAGDQVFTGAHIVYGGRGGESKIDCVTATASTLWTQRRYLAKVARFQRSLQAVFNELIKIEGIGGFIAYEIVSDYRHTRLLNDATDINAWANVGPGAFRGLRRLNPALRYKDGLPMMRELLVQSREPGVLGEHVPPLELREIEHASCEFSKFCKVKFGEGRPRSRYNGQAGAVE